MESDSSTSSPKKTKLGLPDELVKAILENLFYSCHSRVELIVPASAASKEFRQILLPFLFESLHLELCKSQHGSPELLCKTNISKDLFQYVRKLYMVPDSSQNQPSVPLSSCLEHMPRVKTVWFHCDMHIAFRAFDAFSNRPDVHLILRQAAYGSLTMTPLSFDEVINLLRGKALIASIGKFSCSDPVLSEAGNDALATRTSKACYRQFGGFSPISSDPQLFDAGEVHSGTKSKSFSVPEELWLDFTYGAGDSRDRWLNELQKHNLLDRILKLAILLEGRPRPFRHFISETFPMMRNLKRLHIHAEYAKVFHKGCPYEVGAGVHTPESPTILVDFSGLENLIELRIERICHHVPVTKLVPPNLKILALNWPHTVFSTISQQSERTPEDLITLRNIAPNIERLELDYEHADSWYRYSVVHDAAANRIHRFLEELAHFPNLRNLHLFPTFGKIIHTERTIEIELNQIESHKKALSVFVFLKESCPSLQTLSIMPSMERRMNINGDIKPITYEIGMVGDQTIILAGQDSDDTMYKFTWNPTLRRYRDPVSGEPWADLKRRDIKPRPYPYPNEGWFFNVFDILTSSSGYLSNHSVLSPTRWL